MDSIPTIAHYGAALSGAGDVDGDGYDDVLIGMPGYDGSATLTDTGQVLLFAGSSTGVASSPAWSVTGTITSEQVGTAVTSADVNEDGYSEVVVGANNVARAYHGGSVGVQMSAAWEESRSGFGGFAFGYATANAGDVNGDGYADVLVGAPLEYTFLTVPGYAYLYCQDRR